MKVILIVLFLGGMVGNAFAQQMKKDTIYYLLDTAKTPKNDRMIWVSNDKTEKIFVIDCPCLRSDGAKPIFQIRNNPAKTIDSEILKSYKLTSISSIIKLAIDNDKGNEFNEKYILFVIQPIENGKYTITRAVNEGPTRRWNTTN